MLFLRTAAGGFVDAVTVGRLREEKEGWVAICDDDPEVAVAACRIAPGRFKELQHLLSAQRPGSPAEGAACGSCACAL